MKICLVGGHMAPALGLLDVLPSSFTVVYIGREHVFEGDTGVSLEQKIVTSRGIKFIPLVTGRIQRTLTAQTVPSLLRIPTGFTKALRILREEKPDIVVGFGGYVSVPIGVAARFLGIPLVIHESTLHAGLANKMLAPFAQKICISWESSRALFPKKKTVLTGDPLLPFSSTKEIPLPKSREKLPLVVISGGSGGSHALNSVILQMLPDLLSIAKVIHQTGDAKVFQDFTHLTEKVKTLPKNLQDRYLLTKFIHPEQVNSLFAKADLVIGRSGINTVTTLLVLKKKAILIPLPVGQKDEQRENAQLMESEGLATIINQHVLSPKILFQRIEEMLTRRPGKVRWHIPVQTNGAQNLMKEVIACLPQQEK